MNFISYTFHWIFILLPLSNCNIPLLQNEELISILIMSLMNDKTTTRRLNNIWMHKTHLYRNHSPDWQKLVPTGSCWTYTSADWPTPHYGCLFWLAQNGQNHSPLPLITQIILCSTLYFTLLPSSPAAKYFAAICQSLQESGVAISFAFLIQYDNIIGLQGQAPVC